MHRSTPSRGRRAALATLALLIVAGVGVTACDVPKPVVTFFSAGRTVTTLPSKYCNDNLTSCQNASVLARLAVPAGGPLQISVPPRVAATPWLVAFTYRQANGQTAQGRSALFPAGQRYAYTLTMPTGADRLETVEVDQVGAALSMDQNGYELYVRAVWDLSATS
ncbi:MAG TPA: DUF2771 family protein [Pseudonocardiaceae bacterium]